MKRVIFLVGALAAVISLSSCATKNTAPAGKMPAYGPGEAPAVSSAEPEPPFASSDWPITFDSGANTYTVFEPQSDSWDGHTLAARSAVGIRSPNENQPVYGTISFTAITLVDKSKQAASLADVKVRNLDFPSANAQQNDYLAVLREQFPKRVQPVPLDHLESTLTAQNPKPEALNNTPPKVIIATRPAILVSIDGPPVWRPVPGTRLMRAINTRMLLLKDESGKCYLHLFDGYLEAASLTGHWSVATQPPPGSASAEKSALDSGQTDLMEGQPDATTQKMPSLSTSVTPDVFVTTKPAELITFSGQPQYAPISGTELVYAANTSANVFKLLTDQQNYILISGRWYRAPSLDGPWQFVAGDQLPHDFANIPDTSPKENVKASVPSTQQAEEALIANSIPQSTAVSRTTRMQDPGIDGPPKLAPIQDTLLHYVINSSTPIIEVNSESWYACQNGVWFVSHSVNGPWTVATYVPSVLYTIPTSSPLHFVTYVQVYGSTPDVVYEGYTPGYLGTEVADDGTVVYGTGYDYTPWVGDYWYCGPATWGYGFDCCWNPWWGWGYDCGFGWGCWGWGFGWWGLFPPFPFFGGFGHHFHDHGGHGRGGGGFAFRGNTGANLYRHDASSNGRGEQFVRQGDYARAYNSRTGRIAGGQSGRVQNVSGAAWDPRMGGGFEQNNGYRSFGGQNYGHGSSFYGKNAGRGGWGYGGYYHSGGGWFHGGGGGNGGRGGGGEGGGHGGGGGGGGGGGHGGR